MLLRDYSIGNIFQDQRMFDCIVGTEERANEKKSDCDKQLCHLCEWLNFLN